MDRGGRLARRLRRRSGGGGRPLVALIFAAPVDRLDIEAERILAEDIGGARRLHRDGEHRGPARRRREAAALIGAFLPLHLPRARRGANDACDLDRDRPCADVRRIGLEMVPPCEQVPGTIDEAKMAAKFRRVCISPE